MANKKFTFKTDKPTGKYSSFYNKTHNVKLGKSEIGLIKGQGKHGAEDPPYKINLRIIKSDINEDGNPQTSWKWITLKKECQSLDEAKEWLNLNFEKLNSVYKFPTDRT